MTENECIERLKIFPEWNRDDCWLNTDDMEDLVNSCVKALEEIQQYRAIGTVEECREASERQIKKKPVKNEYNHDCCPNCRWIVYQDEWGGRYLPHCENCGQAIDWSGERVQKFRKKKGVQYEK
ncbi:MAG: hypothetical protein K1W24_06480 [Lachnospiraceae bacterium]